MLWHILWHIYRDIFFLHKGPTRALIGRGAKGTWLSQPLLHCPPDVGCVWRCCMACAKFRRIMASAFELLHGWSGATLHGCWRTHSQSGYSTLLALTHNPDLFNLESVHNAMNIIFVLPAYSKGFDARGVIYATGSLGTCLWNPKIRPTQVPAHTQIKDPYKYQESRCQCFVCCLCTHQGIHVHLHACRYHCNKAVKFIIKIYTRN